MRKLEFYIFKLIHILEIKFMILTPFSNNFFLLVFLFIYEEGKGKFKFCKKPVTTTIFAYLSPTFFFFKIALISDALILVFLSFKITLISQSLILVFLSFSSSFLNTNFLSKRCRKQSSGVQALKGIDSIIFLS